MILPMMVIELSPTSLNLLPNLVHRHDPRQRICVSELVDRLLASVLGFAKCPCAVFHVSFGQFGSFAHQSGAVCNKRREPIVSAIVRMKAAGIILLAKKAIFKEGHEKAEARHKKIQAMLKLAREKDDKELATKIEHMRSFADRFGSALREQSELIKAVNILKDPSNVLKKFITDMQGLQDRIDTAMRLYKEKKKQVQAELKGSDDNELARFLVWINSDSPSADLAKFFGQLFVAIAEAAK
jgi:hypothetical protein